MECIYIYGDSQSGKSTYAKQIARDHNYSVFVSGGGNDVLDGYSGEDCVILDDLRPSTVALADLLKMLDNNTASSVKSRFRNKILECKVIIITTTKPIDEFFGEVFQNEGEPKVQLMRRCGLLIHMTKDVISLSVYDRALRDYKRLKDMPNFVLDQFHIEELTEEQQLDYASKLLGTSAENINTLAGMLKQDTPNFVEVQSLLDDHSSIPF